MYMYIVSYEHGVKVTYMYVSRLTQQKNLNLYTSHVRKFGPKSKSSRWTTPVFVCAGVPQTAAACTSLSEEWSEVWDS